MCKYSILAQSKDAYIRYCHCCKTYTVTFNNLLMNFAPSGLSDFKAHLTACYEANVRDHCEEHRGVRDITFSTRLDGLSFLFSTQEVGELLSLIQQAQLSELLVEEIK
ncbi:MAG: DUF6686 family protein [Bacteroidota bacterium]